MSKPGYCQHDAGILVDDELSDVAKKRFIDEVLRELRLGSAAVKNALFPIDLGLPPQPSYENVPLDDPEAFPDFHKNVLGQYRSIARALDAKSRYTFLPICCPASLATSLGADVPRLKFPDEFIIYGFTLPMLATKLGFPVPTDLATKLPTLIELPIPNVQLPTLDFDAAALPDLLSFNSAFFSVPPKLITAALELLTRMPELALGILTFDLSAFVDVVISSKFFGDFDPTTATTWLVAQRVLAIRAIECLLIYAVGTTMGSSSGGLVGGLGTLLGYTPPPTVTTTAVPRDLAGKAARAASGQSWSGDRKRSDDPRADLRYCGFLLPQEVDDGRGATQALEILRSLDATHVFARALCFRAGASSKFFTERLATDDVGAALEREVSSLGALSRVAVTTFEPKVGDIIVLERGSLAVTSVSRDGKEVSGILGGAVDPDNEPVLSRIDEITATISRQGSVSLSFGGRIERCRYVIDVDRFS